MELEELITLVSDTGLKIYATYYQLLEDATTDPTRMAPVSFPLTDEELRALQED